MEKILEKPLKSNDQTSIKVTSKLHQTPNQASPKVLDKPKEPIKPLETPKPTPKPIEKQASEVLNEETSTDVNMTVTPIKDLYEDDLEDFLQNYFQLIPVKFKDTFLSSIPDIIAKAFQEDLNFLQFLDKDNQRIGLAIMHIDKNFLSFKRLSIIHFSMIFEKNEIVENALKTLLTWIWTHDNSEEIRINLFHKLSPVTNELELEKPLQEVFLKNGFRWKLLTNDKSTSTRFTTYGLKRKSDEFPSPDMQSEPIIYKSSAILSQKVLKPKNSYDNQGIFDNINCQLNALKAFGELDEDSLSRNKLDLLLGFRNLPNFLMPGMKCKDFYDPNELKNFLVENKFEEIPNEIQWEDSEEQEIQEKIICSLGKACYRWENFRTLDVDNGESTEKFLRIIPDETSQDLYYIGIVGENKRPMYILPTDDEKVKIFIYNAGN